MPIIIDDKYKEDKIAAYNVAINALIDAEDVSQATEKLAKKLVKEKNKWLAKYNKGDE